MQRGVCHELLAASIVLAVLLGAAPVAHADLTLFAGTNVTPSNRPVRGVAVGFSLLIVGFEFEYSDTTADEMAGAPRLQSGMFNMLVQTPFGVAGLQFYGTAGGGLFREEGSSLLETNAGTNFGGGVKISIAGPIRMRVDYRVFRLVGTPQHTAHQRIYAGLNIGF